ncbi:hypothetical protein PGTUg99_012996 [Puccinia graminis f. sp. tritici]|uniref:Uncharacterized protein n=1 Tax=Puccinia graminis f. sp. tritici TaxID=56615 RepID=A0A5B0Q3Q5_PUCGR|nr:hypothetical protein PGTUg99_012996 [Puccinia graminis f. sp. tritici]
MARLFGSKIFMTCFTSLQIKFLFIINQLAVLDKFLQPTALAGTPMEGGLGICT